jgi:hypothetical protein
LVFRGFVCSPKDSEKKLKIVDKFAKVLNNFQRSE